METESLKTRSGIELIIEKGQSEVLLRMREQRPCILHWGLRNPKEAHWQLPPSSLWPEGTKPFGHHAAQSPFLHRDGGAEVVVRLQANEEASSLEFALFFPQHKKWDNNGGRNYRIEIAPPQPEPPRGPAPGQVLADELGPEPLVFQKAYELRGHGELAVAVRKEGQRFRVWMLSNLDPLLLHWGIAQDYPDEWLLPPPAMRPPGTVINQNTTQTPFPVQNGFSRLEMSFEEARAPLGLQFVLKEGDTGRWLHDSSGKNFYVPILPGPKPAPPLDKAALSGITKQMIQVETGNQSWTLMHRFNLCYDLLQRAGQSPDALAVLFVWLRYSALRQLTWQRNYNTKPRELSHAEDRLTQRFAEIYRLEPNNRPLIRLMLTTVGRGGEGQKVRDEILNVMHRHHIKEVSGHFLEEWHQKLHNNTTPDDIVICEAYLAFLRANGDRGKFYEALQAGGVTRERLQSFERPIRSEPDFHGHLKEGLIHDFENFLRVLKSVHAGTDLETGLNVAQGQLDGETRRLAYELWNRKHDPSLSLIDKVGIITATRRRLGEMLKTRSEIRDLLYLDLALEQFLRGVVEQNIHLQIGRDQLVEHIGHVVENLNLSQETPELVICGEHWGALKNQPRFSQEWSLHAKSVLDRIARALSGWIDSMYQLLQPKAEFLGHAFKTDDWTITLFSEEVVRGNSLGFVLSMLLHHLDPILRESARLGSWQIVSRGKGAGKVEVVKELRSVQGKQYDGPRVIIAECVLGDEEVPEMVKAVIAPDVTDIVSHVAVRARNANLLFASCYDPELLNQLKRMQGKFVELEVTPAGDVLFREGQGEAPPAKMKQRARRMAMARLEFSDWAIALEQFNEKSVGQKSLHQLKLKRLLPEWIHQPKSVALPFGVCEKVLGLEQNRAVAEECNRLMAEIAHDPPKALSSLRKALLNLQAPEELFTSLAEVMQQNGLALPANRDLAWQRIKQVWASKWNDRAYFSRQAVGLADSDLFMAVLVQEVVPAQYAFVIHTVNPMTGNKHELFAEVVLGLGETLVGNFPGRALSFVSNKKTREQTILSFPGKSTGLYGSGLIFRSDSNGEDLAGYAGAGLYESVLLEPPKHVLLNYKQEPLVWQPDFRRQMLENIAKLGQEIERLLGAAQDIEGAVVNGQYYVVQTRPQVQV